VAAKKSARKAPKKTAKKAVKKTANKAVKKSAAKNRKAPCQEVSNLQGATCSSKWFISFICFNYFNYTKASNLFLLIN
jgi:hypothetical protein